MTTGGEPADDTGPRQGRLRAGEAARAGEGASRDVATLGGLLALAAALRLPGLLARGPWDVDQANDMATLQAFVSNGVVPLLGPPTSIGNVHHGAPYYYLLAPAALPSGGRDPLEVVALIAVMGIAAVAVTWWLARSVGGPVAGLVAGLLAATSATAVSSSTFIWNPNPIPLFAAIAVGGALAAWRSRRPAWWLVAALGQAVVQQCHILGIFALPALALLFVADARRRPSERRRFVRYGILAVAIIAAGYMPLAIHELSSNFSEARNAIAWATAPGADGGPGIVARLLLVPLRVVAWPLTGRISDSPVAALMAVTVVGALAAWRIRAANREERAVAAWLVAYVGIAALLLAIFVSSLGTVTPLPNDHYHAFVAPALFALAGLAAAALWQRDVISRMLAIVGIGALVGWNLMTQPPPVAADGGWPAARDAGMRLARAAEGQPLAFLGVPDFKPPTAYVYPFRLAGGSVAESVSQARRVAIVCDDLFRKVTGSACGGPAEAAALGAALGAAGMQGVAPVVVERFAPAPGRTLTVYLLGGP